MVLKRLLRALRPAPDRPLLPVAPDDMRLYAIGDIHGRLDLLQQLQEKISIDLQQQSFSRAVIIYLGDVVDRGPASAQVVELLANRPVPGAEQVCLCGNHEYFLQIFLEDPLGARVWLDYGGLATIQSYGVQISPGLSPEARIMALSKGLKAAIPPHHLEFLSKLPLTYEAGDYFFTHAGVHPGRPLNQQLPMDLISIREPFLDWNQPLDKMIVHGHTISSQPEFRPHRIGLDTGAFMSGRLSCLVLQGKEQYLLS